MAPNRSQTSSSAPASGQAVVPLPDYEAPSHPLNEKAQISLRNLPRNHKLDSLKEKYKTANNHLSQAAGDINDRLQSRIIANDKRKARQQAQGSFEDDMTEDRQIDEMRGSTDAATNELEASVRNMIDGGEQLKRFEDVLRDLDANVTNARGPNGHATQSTLGASQFRPDRSYTADGEDDDENSEAHMTVPPVSVWQTVKQKATEQQETYNALSRTERYASHNDYVSFRKIVHDAHYPGDQAPPLPNSSTWFPGENGSSQETSERVAGGSQAVEEDDDVAIATESINIKCPITLTEMKDPVSSTKCPHNYERQAFNNLLSVSDVWLDADGNASGPGSRSRRQRAMRCPVPGCEVVCHFLHHLFLPFLPSSIRSECERVTNSQPLPQTLTSNDIQTNAVLVRRIKRIRAAQNARNEEYEDDDAGDASMVAGNNVPQQNRPVHGSSSAKAPSTRVRAERMSLAPNTQRSMVSNSQLGSADDEDSGLMNTSLRTDDVEEEHEDEEDEEDENEDDEEEDDEDESMSDNEESEML